MPIAHVHLIEGRSDAQKAAVIAKVTAALAEAAEVSPEAVRVLIHDVPKVNWGIGGHSAKSLGR
ncbi:tautomerase family protein [Nevskia ramosa]|uniref:tautomerase family protein n=1 Tax=Nevskia ramosa TaxID=64002 RepID=UPI0003B6A069|nr:2-hydroxymuconate tautomerase family protein [Nevskia ramosa]|eukprot:gene5689-7716_t